MTLLGIVYLTHFLFSFCFYLRYGIWFETTGVIRATHYIVCMYVCLYVCVVSISALCNRQKAINTPTHFYLLSLELLLLFFFYMRVCFICVSVVHIWLCWFIFKHPRQFYDGWWYSGYSNTLTFLNSNAHGTKPSNCRE